MKKKTFLLGYIWLVITFIQNRMLMTTWNSNHMFFTMSREGGMAINLPAQLLNLISHICGTARPHKASDLPPNSLLLGKGGLEGGGWQIPSTPPLSEIKGGDVYPRGFLQIQICVLVKTYQIFILYSKATLVFLGKSSILGQV